MIIKKILSLAFIILILFCCKEQKDEGVKIHAIIKNSDQEFVLMYYNPLYRGNLNFDDYRSIGTRIDKKGNFYIKSENISHSAYYSIAIKDKIIPIILFNGDDIQLDFDLYDIDDSLFVYGKGAGKINVLNLEQYKQSYDWIYDSIVRIDYYKKIIDDVITSQLQILQAIYVKDTSNIIIKEAVNKSIINKIIKETPLSDKEYVFLKNKINLQKFELIGYIKNIIEPSNNDTAYIDYFSSYFNQFNKNEYKYIDNVNNWEFGSALNNILLIEYLRVKQKKSNRLLSYSDWEYYWEDSLFNEVTYSSLKQNFKSDIYNNFFANELTNLMTLGFYDVEDYIQFENNCTDNKYLKRIDEFKNLLENGLDNKEYNLGDENCSLDSLKLESLLKKYKDKTVYIVIWSAQYAGAYIIPFLPSIKDFVKNNKKEIDVLYICIDEIKYKNLWAARVIDNSWKGNHYFVAKEGNYSIINKFNSMEIFSMCKGGVTFSLINKVGILFNNIENPMMIEKEKLNNYIETEINKSY